MGIWFFFFFGGFFHFFLPFSSPPSPRADNLRIATLQLLRHFAIVYNILLYIVYILQDASAFVR